MIPCYLAKLISYAYHFTTLVSGLIWWLITDYTVIDKVTNMIVLYKWSDLANVRLACFMIDWLIILLRECLSWFDWVMRIFETILFLQKRWDRCVLEIFHLVMETLLEKQKENKVSGASGKKSLFLPSGFTHFAAGVRRNQILPAFYSWPFESN